MSSTLCIRKTPVPPRDSVWHFKLPVKGVIARKFYNHDGTLGGEMITIGPEHLEWFEGVLAAGRFDEIEARKLREVVAALQDGSIDMWFEV